MEPISWNVKIDYDDETLWWTWKIKANVTKPNGDPAVLKDNGQAMEKETAKTAAQDRAEILTKVYRASLEQPEEYTIEL